MLKKMKRVNDFLYEPDSNKTKMIKTLKRKQGRCADCLDNNNADFLLFMSHDMSSHTSIYKMTLDKIKRADELGEFVCKLCWYKRWDVIRNNRGLSFVTDPFIRENLNLRKGRNWNYQNATYVQNW